MCCYPALSQVLQSVSPSHGAVDHTLQRTPPVHQLLFTLVHTACPAHLLILLCPRAHFQFPRSPADHFTDLIAVLTIPKAPEKPHSASTLSTCFGVNFCLLQSVHLFHSWVFSSFLGNPGGMPLSVLESQVGSGKWDVLQGRFGSSLSNLSEGEVPAVGGVSEQGGEKSNLPLGLVSATLEHCSASVSLTQVSKQSPLLPTCPEEAGCGDGEGFSCLPKLPGDLKPSPCHVPPPPSGPLSATSGPKAHLLVILLQGHWSCGFPHQSGLDCSPSLGESSVSSVPRIPFLKNFWHCFTFFNVILYKYSFHSFISGTLGWPLLLNPSS